MHIRIFLIKSQPKSSIWLYKQRENHLIPMIENYIQWILLAMLVTHWLSYKSWWVKHLSLEGEERELGIEWGNIALLYFLKVIQIYCKTNSEFNNSYLKLYFLAQSYSRLTLQAYDLESDQLRFDLQFQLLLCQQIIPKFQRLTVININFLFMLHEGCGLAIAL